MVQTVAACCGLFGFRSTPGMVQLDGVETVLGSIDTLGWMTRDALLLQRVGAAYGLPGGGYPNPTRGLPSMSIHSAGGAALHAAAARGWRCCWYGLLVRPAWWWAPSLFPGLRGTG